MKKKQIVYDYKILYDSQNKIIFSISTSVLYIYLTNFNKVFFSNLLTRCLFFSIEQATLYALLLFYLSFPDKHYNIPEW